MGREKELTRGEPEPTGGTNPSLCSEKKKSRKGKAIKALLQDSLGQKKKRKK